MHNYSRNTAGERTGIDAHQPSGPSIPRLILRTDTVGLGRKLHRHPKHQQQQRQQQHKGYPKRTTALVTTITALSTHGCIVGTGVDGTRKEHFCPANQSSLQSIVVQQP